MAVLRNPSARQSFVRLRFVGANDHASTAGERRTGGITNDFRGSDPRRWRSGIPHFERVRRSGVYDGIDVVYRKIIVAARTAALLLRERR